MQQTLLRIPLHGPWSLGPLGEVPGFGVGLVLFLWLGFGVLALVLRVRKTGFDAELVGPALAWLVVAAAVVMLPTWVQRGSKAKIAELTRMIEQQPQPSADQRAILARAHVERADAFAQVLDFTRATDDCREAIDLAPDFAEAHRKLAWLLATCPANQIRNAKEAQDHARRACQLTDFEQASALDTLAVSCAEAGDFVQAISWEQQAAERAFISMEIQERVLLGDIRKRLGSFQASRPYRHRFGVSVPVFGYGAMLFVGFLCAGGLASRRADREGLGNQVIWDFAMWLFVAGIFGARLFYLIQKHDQVFRGARSVGEYLMAAINLREGGLVLYGGVLGDWLLISCFVIAGRSTLSISQTLSYLSFSSAWHSAGWGAF